MIRRQKFQIPDDVVLRYDRTWFLRMPDSRDTNSLHNNPGSHRIGVPSRNVQSQIRIRWNKLRTLTRNVQRRLNEALIDNSVTTINVSPEFCEPWCPFTHHECRYHKLEIMGAHSIAVFLHSASCSTVMRPTKHKRHTRMFHRDKFQ